MNYHIRFTKATGAGNDFVILDNRKGDLPADIPALARLLCSRNFGVGADGILVVGLSNVADFSMGYYNADGSTGGMCGNGGRCIARFAHERGIAAPTMRFDAFGHVYKAEVTPGSVNLQMKPPRDLRANIRLTRGSESFTAGFVNTGSPHTVVFVDDVDRANVGELGPWLRYHPEFAPEGTNANFVQVTGPASVRVRTYERGVESETLACGTGSVAAAVVFRETVGIASPVQVSVRSGAELRVHFPEDPETGRTETILEGPANILFDGECLVDILKHELRCTSAGIWPSM